MLRGARRDRIPVRGLPLKRRERDVAPRGWSGLRPCRSAEHSSVLGGAKDWRPKKNGDGEDGLVKRRQASDVKPGARRRKRDASYFRTMAQAP